MSKSLGNTLLLSDPPEELLKKIRGMVTDPRKVYKGDVGHPDICAVFALQLVFNVAESEHLRTGCETGSLGCVDCKKSLVAALGEALRPIQAYRAQLVADMGRIERILENGCERARAVAEDTMKEVRRALLLW
jgi:tryptophanyl-tRNA synthetase